MNEMKLDEMAAWCRVIGFGNDAEATIEGVKALDYTGLSAMMADRYPKDIIPSEYDRLCVLVTAGDVERVKPVARSFYQAGVLTLLVTDDATAWHDLQVDSTTAVDSGEWLTAIRIVLEPIFSPYGIICYDFNDVASTLRGSGRFKVMEATSEGQGNNVEGALRKLRYGPDAAVAERMSMLVHYNREETELTMMDMKPLMEITKELPESLDLIWGVYGDQSMPKGRVRISIMMAGKEVES